jgi:hypothetical protein
LITAFTVGKNLPEIGRKTAIKSSINLMSIATLLFCFASIHGVYGFYALSAIARLT